MKISRKERSVLLDCSGKVFHRRIGWRKWGADSDLSRIWWENAVRRVILLIEQWGVRSELCVLHDDFIAMVLFSRRNGSNWRIPWIALIRDQSVMGERICISLSLLTIPLKNHTLPSIAHPNAMCSRHKNRMHIRIHKRTLVGKNTYAPQLQHSEYDNMK